ncbi:type II CAAX endopeptidase family protein [Dyella sp. ASV21]|uniref:CPBP family intramembrane glutamic endopeptidase n=1 Tax=Dyella sp. ASV21 TaxID=2795114 RepID=UPI0018EB4722|nr:type II CAAX endopeptidase family protein [Dyella sp. ASV21]
MQTTDVLLALCAAWLVGVAPWLDLSTGRRLQRRSDTRGRLAFYRQSIAWLWLSALVVAVIAPWGAPWVIQLPAAGSGWLNLPWFRATGAVLLTIYFALALWPGLHALLVKGARPRYLRALGRLQFVLPVSPRERAWWALTSLTAGICEEWLYRGFLMQYLAGRWHGPSLGLVGALVASSIVFGLGHLYQGKRGVLTTSISGMLFGLLACTTGSLAAPMLLHVLIDLQVLAMYWPSHDDPAMAQALMSGSPGKWSAKDGIKKPSSGP